MTIQNSVLQSLGWYSICNCFYLFILTLFFFLGDIQFGLCVNLFNLLRMLVLKL